MLENQYEGTQQCQRHWPLNDLASGPVFDALFAKIGATVSGTKITGLGLYPATWWWRNFTDATCWHGVLATPAVKVGSQVRPVPQHLQPRPRLDAHCALEASAQPATMVSPTKRHRRGTHPIPWRIATSIYGHASARDRVTASPRVQRRDAIIAHLDTPFTDERIADARP